MLQQFDGVVFIVEQPPTSAKKQWAYTTSQGVLGGLINEGWRVGGGIITRLFKTTAFQDKLHSSAAKKMLFNFTRSFKLQNIVKNRFHFNTG